MNFFSRSKWGALAPSSATQLVPANVTTWYTHWVGANDMAAFPSLAGSIALMQRLQRDAMSEGYADFEYNWAVDPAGRIFEGRGYGVVSGATKGRNLSSLSVVYLAGPGVPLTDAAKGALLTLTSDGARRYPSIQAVQSHKTVYPTQCPGAVLHVFSGDLTNHLHDLVVDWAVLAALAAWVQRLSDSPLHFGQGSPDVLPLKQLLRNHGYDVDDGEFFGDKVRIAVRKFKLENHLENTDGKVCGADCAKALLTLP